MCEQSKLTYGDRNQKGAGWYWGEKELMGKEHKRTSSSNGNALYLIWVVAIYKWYKQWTKLTELNTKICAIYCV